MNNDFIYWLEMSNAYLEKAMSIGKTSDELLTSKQKLLRLVAIRSNFDMMTACAGRHWELLKERCPRMAIAHDNQYNFAMKAEILENLDLEPGSKQNLLRDIAVRSHTDTYRAEGAVFNQLYASLC